MYSCAVERLLRNPGTTWTRDARAREKRAFTGKCCSVMRPFSSNLCIHSARLFAAQLDLEVLKRRSQMGWYFPSKYKVYSAWALRVGARRGGVNSVRRSWLVGPRVIRCHFLGEEIARNSGAEGSDSRVAPWY